MSKLIFSSLKSHFIVIWLKLFEQKLGWWCWEMEQKHTVVLCLLFGPPNPQQGRDTGVSAAQGARVPGSALPARQPHSLRMGSCFLLCSGCSSSHPTLGFENKRNLFLCCCAWCSAERMWDVLASSLSFLNLSVSLLRWHVCVWPVSIFNLKADVAVFHCNSQQLKSNWSFHSGLV